MPHPQLCNAMPTYVSCHILNYAMPCHHYFSLSLSLSWHHIHWLYYVCHAIISTGYSFVIREHLWHQWKLYTQPYPPLALMETSKHSPPLTTMTKDNLLCQCCTYFDIGFPLFLLYDNSPYHHISRLLIWLCYLINVLSFILTLPFLQQVLGSYLNW